MRVRRARDGQLPSLVTCFHRGFSLVELMMAVAVASILLVVAVPSMQRFMTARAVVAQAEELTSTLRLARSAALSLVGTVSVCIASDPAAVDPACANSTDWSRGWLTFIDLDGDGERDSGERLLKATTSLAAIDGIESGNVRFVSFFGNGLAKSGSASFVVKPRIDKTDSSYAAAVRRVCLNQQGRAALLPGNGACP